MEFTYVSDIIGEEYKSWNSERPVIIHAQTGTGKTYFVLERLLPYVQELGKKMVYLSNRIALQEQVKKQIDPQYSDSIVVCNYQYFAYVALNPLDTNRWDLSQDEKERFEFYEQIKSADYFVLDEAHFFLADSDFNVEVGQCLSRMKEIRERQSNSVWIFMTATIPYLLLALTQYFYIKAGPLPEIPYIKTPVNTCIEPNNPIRNSDPIPLYNPWTFHNVESLLRYKEYDSFTIKNFEFQWDEWKECYPPKPHFPEFWDRFGRERRNHFSNIFNRYSEIFECVKAQCHYYNISSSFSYITPVYYSTDEDLLNAVVASPPEEKWLIFVENKSRGEMLCNELIERGLVDTVFITAQNKGKVKTLTGKVFRNIVEFERFPQKVLIATKVLDNGINLKDPNLRHIAIESFDETTFIQMLGRKRRIDPSEKINLYIMDLSEDMARKKFQNRILRIVILWNSLKYLQARKFISNTFSYEVNAFLHEYTKNGHYKNEYKNYVTLSNLNYSVGSDFKIKENPGLLIDIFPLLLL